MNKLIFVVSLLFTYVTSSIFAQTDVLKTNIEQLIKTKKATVGVAIYGFESKESITVNNELQYPLQSVFKFHIALAVLNQVNKGKLRLNQKIFIKPSDLLPNTWSPMREKYPNANVSLSIAEIIQYTVGESDNNGCDILLRLIGGTKTVNDYIHKVGIKEVAIVANEEEMHKAWDVQFSNWTKPMAATELLKIFYDKKITSKANFDFLWKVMIDSPTGKKRIKSQLPEGTLVAHKTGTSDTNEEGITSAVNDIGIVTLPNGKHFAISVFVSNSKENGETNEKIIADISKLAWDYFVAK
ncbi:class A beta-lactamase, subclass A2 [Arcicella sp. DC2W]|uniref:Beta-lactamase n=1 Tax=Arcicella gelida TaxID=2984195 RepID=A0ABU5S6D0_9BACT|nr:class A beta-lactamase, subclass A2 [Arcicella sp. DC2W]MEA5403982.1 class A beta-lactamase, subclass A2 [Arcicella sp. DC2W]